ncbi:phage integrase N-terminal SAM-like domain-containing protein [uncultured Microbulbifer sp.]|uniref:phage integrase N-terminal SAM-like domain-containing protein n=1 Tax=uncultured Microbulbifer sp. TaxID=348147 RepID=UPI00344B0D3B
MHCSENILAHSNARAKPNRPLNLYSHAIRRVCEYFDSPPDTLAQRQLEDYFEPLISTHSWPTAEGDRNGLQFFYKHVLTTGSEGKNTPLPGHAVNTSLYARNRHPCLIRSWQRGILPSCFTSKRKRDWQWVYIIRPPQERRLPDVLTFKELERLINGTRERRYQTSILTCFRMSLPLSVSWRH